MPKRSNVSSPSSSSYILVIKIGEKKKERKRRKRRSWCVFPNARLHTMVNDACSETMNNERMLGDGRWYTWCLLIENETEKG
jgi:hypothetical protein